MWWVILFCAMWTHVMSSQNSENLSKCRAQCLAATNAEENCRQDCQLCWKGCLQADLIRPGGHSKKRKPCLKYFCRMGYKFYKNITKYPPNVIEPQTSFDWKLDLRYTGGYLTWNGLMTSSPVLYVVRLFNKDGVLLEKNQVQQSRYSPTHDLQDVDLIQITVVDKSKVLAIKSITMPTVLVSQTTKPPNNEMDNDIKTNFPWELQLVNLSKEDGGNSVEAELQWSPQALGGVKRYLVTWEVVQEEFGVKGHLYTDTNKTSLSLWPNSSYKVLVEVVDGDDHPDRTSTPLYLDTHLSTDLPVSSTLVQPVNVTSQDNQQWQFIAGGIAGTALILFIFLHTLVVRKMSRSRDLFAQKTADLSNLDDDLDLRDKERGTLSKIKMWINPSRQPFGLPVFTKVARDGSTVSNTFSKYRLMFSPRISLSGLKESRVNIPEDVR